MNAMIRDTLTSRALNDSSSARNFPKGCLASCVEFAKKAVVSTVFVRCSVHLCVQTLLKSFCSFLFCFFKIASASGISTNYNVVSNLTTLGVVGVEGGQSG